MSDSTEQWSEGETKRNKSCFTIQLIYRWKRREFPVKLLKLILAWRLWQCWHASRCWDFPCLPARIVYFCSCSFDEWWNWFFNKRSKPQSKVACQFWHLFGKSWTQFFDCVQIIIHGSWKIHEVVEINWIIFTLANLDLYRFFMSY